jgi:uncharacterized protein (TIGR00255 family)
MIHSMTAFARADNDDNGLQIHTEIRGYNSKNLDISLRLSSGWLSLEEEVKRKIAEKIDRGRIEITIQVADRSEKALSYDIDEAKATAYHQVLLRLKETLSLSETVTLAMLAQTPGIIKPSETRRDPEADWPSICACLEQALSDLTAMRRKEGVFLEKDLTDRLSTVESALVEIKAAAADLPARYRDRLTERISALTEGQIALDGARIAQEAALLADRSDISEEVVRAECHIQQFRHIMEEEKEAGRKLNFLLQELNREFTTMGAKAGNAPIAHRIVMVKSELEKMREQVQNVE